MSWFCDTTSNIGRTRVLVVLEREMALGSGIVRILRTYADCSRRLPTSVRIARFSTANSAKPDYCLMVAIQFTNRFLGVQPEVRECGQFLQNLCPELLSVFAAGVEVSCELVEVTPYLAALGKQGGDCFQCVLTALCDYHGVPDIHTEEDAADECGLGEVEFFAAVLNAQLFFCGHSEFDDVCLSRRVVAVLSCVSVRIFHFSHIRPPVKIENALIPDGRGYVKKTRRIFAPTVRSGNRGWGRATVAKQ